MDAVKSIVFLLGCWLASLVVTVSAQSFMPYYGSGSSLSGLSGLSGMGLGMSGFSGFSGLGDYSRSWSPSSSFRSMGSFGSASSFFPSSSGSSYGGLSFVPAIPVPSKHDTHFHSSPSYPSRRRYSSMYDEMSPSVRREYDPHSDYTYSSLRSIKSRDWDADDVYVPSRRRRPMGMGSSAYPRRFSHWRDEDELHRYAPHGDRYGEDWEEESRRSSKQAPKPAAGGERDEGPRTETKHRHVEDERKPEIRKAIENRERDVERARELDRQRGQEVRARDTDTASSHRDDSLWRPSEPVDIEDFREPEVPPVKGFSSPFDTRGPASRRYSYMGYKNKPRRADKGPYMVVHNLLGMNDSGDYRPYMGPHKA